MGGWDIAIEDTDGALENARAPVCGGVMLPDRLRRAAAEGRLVLHEKLESARQEPVIPAQCLGPPVDGETRLCWLMPPGPAGRRVFTLGVGAPFSPLMVVGQTEGQYEISAQGQRVLRYNYRQVEPGDLRNSISEDNRKYAVARSDYIHPLYGPQGEILTKDWSLDHPHHRGIYWAWPEVDWRGQRGDLHALQRVFARPSGRCETVSGPVFAQVMAENAWLWEDRELIVRERATIRAYAANAGGRIVDLEFHFEAVDDPVLLARRGTSHYGGLNVRLSAVKDQRIIKHVAPAANRSRVSWADLSGLFAGGSVAAGVTIIQLASNPDYPGDWIDYPELNWLQPTFPAAGTRYEIRPGKPLALRFRLWVHRGGTPPEERARAQSEAANSSWSPLA